MEGHFRVGARKRVRPDLVHLASRMSYMLLVLKKF